VCMHGFAGNELVVAEGGGGVRDVLGEHLVQARKYEGPSG
jgi:hypothetical protein